MTLINLLWTLHTPLRGFSLAAIGLIGIAFLFYPHAVYSEQQLILWDRNFDTAPVDKMLQLALNKTEDLYGPAEIERSAPMGPKQALGALNSGDSMDMVSMATSAQHDGQFHTLHFPILQGLLGHRVCLIRKGEQQQFDDLASVYDLIRKPVKICQGAFWPDTQVLKRNGLEVVTSDDYPKLFQMLKEGSCDCFLRGAQEIVPEYEHYSAALEIEQNLVLHYFQPGVVYVNKNNPALATRLELGLLRAWDDGSYQRLFNQLLSDNLKQLRLHKRRYLPLTNPYLSDTGATIEQLEPVWSMPKWLD